MLSPNMKQQQKLDVFSCFQSRLYIYPSDMGVFPNFKQENK